MMGPFGAPLGLVFSTASGARRLLYASHVLRKVKLPKPVVSVGNLTAGGTGKTPFVDLLLTQFEKKGLKVAVLTRGYGRKISSPLLVGPHTTADEGGDEPVWIYERHPKAVIAVGADRQQSAQLAGDVDVYVLDDGFQHFRIERDIDIALVDATSPIDHYRPLPWGMAREGFGALKRADIAVITRSNQVSDDHLDQVLSRVEEQNVGEIILGEVHFAGCTGLVSRKALEIENAKAYLVSGIGNPGSFENLVREIKGLQVVNHEKYRDHAEYDLGEIAELAEQARVSGADVMLITEKDAVKWRRKLGSLENAFALPIGVVSVTYAFTPALPDIYDLALHHFR